MNKCIDAPHSLSLTFVLFVSEGVILGSPTVPIGGQRNVLEVVLSTERVGLLRKTLCEIHD